MASREATADTLICMKRWTGPLKPRSWFAAPLGVSQSSPLPLQLGLDGLFSLRAVGKGSTVTAQVASSLEDLP